MKGKTLIKNVVAGFHACPLEKAKKYENRNVGADVSVCPKEKGITLIALVITIIVLLILAGVTISMVVGENGILTRAKEAKEVSEKASVIEEIRTEVAAKQIDNLGEGEITLDDVIAVIENEIDNGKEWSLSDDKEILTTQSGYKINVGDIWDGEIIKTPAVGDYVQYNLYENENQTSITHYGITISRTSYNWKIAKIEGEKILLLGDDTEPPATFDLYGEDGLEFDLDLVCRTLYSSSVGSARNLHMNDLPYSSVPYKRYSILVI